MKTNMRMSSLVALGTVLLVGWVGLSMAASPPERINFQGVLRDNAGAPVVGTQAMTFRLYDTEVGCPGVGTLLLTDNHALVGVSGGLFNVALGSGTAPPGGLSAAFRDNAAVWVEIEVGGEVLCPRVRVESSAFALNAGNLDGVDSSGYIDTSATAQTKAGNLALGGDLTVNGGDVVLEAPTGFVFLNNGATTAAGPFIRGSSGQVLIRAGAGNLDDLHLEGGNSLDDGRLSIFGDAHMELRAGNGNFSFINGSTGAEIADLSSTGTLQLDRDLTVSGGDVVLDAATGFVFLNNGATTALGPFIRGNTGNIVIRAGANDLDDLHLEGGNSLDDGRLSIFGDRWMELRAGNGNFQFINGSTAAKIADLGAGGDLLIAGTLSVGTMSPPVTYNRFGTVAPISFDIIGGSAILTSEDVMVSSDLEVAERLYVEDIRSRDPEFSVPGGERALNVESIGSLAFMIDWDNDINGSLDEFEWYHGFYLQTHQLAELESNGNFEIRGTFKASTTTFDLAENFLASQRLEPGDLVRVDPAQPNGVLRTSEEHDSQVIGVVSESPAILIGGALFGVGDLDPWGAGIKDEFLEQESQWLESALTDHSELQSLQQELDTLQSRSSEAGLEETNDDPQVRVAQLRETLREAALERFAEQRFAAVALSGRVPVKVDASYGEIQPGDYLTPSPVPGVAMRARESGPVIGTALASLAEGRGKIMAFIHRGHYTPSDGIESAQQELAEQIEERTVDPVTGIQTVPGNLQVLLDRDANDQARFSISRDGQGGLGAEVFRVDERGNVYAGGSFRPASMDLAEYFSVSEPVAVGDVLVADRESLGRFRRGSTSADPAVIGIVSGEPGMLLGSGVSRIAASDPELAVQLDEARRLGDRVLEGEIWKQLEARFDQTHAPVALSGTVQCKVDAGLGAIQVGDLLTSSPTVGHAMRTDEARPGTILGKALQPLDTGTGMIKVLVMLR